MFTNPARRFPAALVAALLAAPALAQVTVIDMGPLPGDIRTFALGISDNGLVCGTSTNSAGRDQGFLWSNGVMTPLGFLSTIVPDTEAQAVNDSGQVTGTTFTERAGRIFPAAFIWQNGVMTELGDLIGLPNFTFANGWDINNAGQIVGTTSNPLGNQAFLWQNGVMTGLGFAGPGPSASVAFGVGSTGHATGFWRPGGTGSEAFLWDGTGMDGLGYLNFAAPQSVGLSVNGSNQVVGFSRNALQRIEAFLWQNGVMTGLGVARSGHTQSSARGINDSGQIVGTSADVAFLYDDGVMIDLNMLLPACSPWRLTVAEDINNAGEIVGTGRIQGQTHGYLLKMGPSNSAPTCSGNPGPFLVNVGQAFSTTVLGTDPDGESLTVLASGVPSGATVGPSGGPSPLSVTFTWTPTINDLGQHLVTITFADPCGEKASCSFDVCVVDLPPTCDPATSAFAVHIGDSFSHALVGQDPDPGDTLAVTSTGLPSGATLGPTSGASPLQVDFAWVPTVNDVGPHLVRVTFTDLGGETIACDFEVFVVNRIPTCGPDSTYARLHIGEPFSLAISGQDLDPGDLLTASHSPLPTGATLSSAGGAGTASAAFAWTPTVYDVGIHEIEVSFTDLNGGVGTCEIMLEVVDRVPTCEIDVDEELFPLDPGGEQMPAVAHRVTVTVGQTFAATFTGDDADPGDLLALSAAGLPAGSTLTPPPGSGSPLFETLFEWAPVDADAAENPHVLQIQFTDLNGEPALCVLEIFVNRPPVAVCPTTALVVECTSLQGALVALDGSASFDPDDDPIAFKWDVSDASVLLDDDRSATPSGTFPIGVTMATLAVTDGRGGVGTCDVLVTVQDTSPPEVMCTTNIAALWPPRHDMRPVTLIVTTSDVCLTPDPTIVPLVVTIRSDEPDDAPSTGDGSTTGDVNGQDGFAAPVAVTSLFSFDSSLGADGAWVATIELRAELNGAGDGRAYTLDVQASDSAGNVSTTSCVIVVPHDRKASAGG